MHSVSALRLSVASWRLIVNICAGQPTTISVLWFNKFMSFSNIISFSITPQSPKIVFQLSLAIAKHFLRKAIYWTTLTADSFGSCCTSINCDCKPAFCHEFIFSIPHCKNVIKSTNELNSTQHVLHRKNGAGLCEHAFGSAGSGCENKVWSWNVVCENYEL